MLSVEAEAPECRWMLAVVNLNLMLASINGRPGVDGGVASLSEVGLGSMDPYTTKSHDTLSSNLHEE